MQFASLEDQKEHYRQCLRDLASLPTDDLPSLEPLQALIDRYQSLLDQAGEQGGVAVNPFGPPGLAPAEGWVTYLWDDYFRVLQGRKTSTVHRAVDRMYLHRAPPPQVAGARAKHAPGGLGGRVTSNTRQKSHSREFDPETGKLKPKKSRFRHYPVIRHVGGYWRTFLKEISK